MKSNMRWTEKGACESRHSRSNLALVCTGFCEHSAYDNLLLQQVQLGATAIDLFLLNQLANSFINMNHDSRIHNNSKPFMPNQLGQDKNGTKRNYKVLKPKINSTDSINVNSFGIFRSCSWLLSYANLVRPLPLLMTSSWCKPTILTGALKDLHWR